LGREKSCAISSRPFDALDCECPRRRAAPPVNLAARLTRVKESTEGLKTRADAFIRLHCLR